MKKGIKFKVREGEIGPQIDGKSKIQDFGQEGTLLEGGGYQYHSHEFLHEGNWKHFLDPVENIEIKLK